MGKGCCKLVLSAVCASLLGAACGDAAKTTAPLPPPVEEKLSVGEFSGVRAYEHCEALCKLGPRPTGSEAYARQVSYITERLRQAGWRVQVVDFAPPAFPTRKMQNVHATFGEGAGARPLLITCHIDTKGQGSEAILGADDGASGAAVLMELARVLAQQPELAAQVELTFFDGEEAFGQRMTRADGLFGSRHDVARRGADLPRWMINLDMVGGAGKTIGVPVVDTSMEMLDQYQTAIDKLGLSEDRWSFYPGSYLDDHKPFIEAGVDALNLIAEFSGSRWWHTAKDDMSRISADSLRESGLVTLQLLRQLLTGAER